ncbi:phage tail tape measure protein [Shinella zoogloeoides]|uniref:Phage tail tape measure protein domain-containing protein n=1 Tax=Shinella zoogloeoides TaxID=352475 RepID=A0A6N8T824_SHIZO|nr:phage tail tape measure protein [Shinella zoogloeoides]MXN99452.1 hypothetical protein [Shinella zoogloeoides]UEX82769.1 phage tail tape measure protein [Shinella zoogloeoides]
MPVRDLDRQARKLNQISTSKAEKEIKALGTAGVKAKRDLDGLGHKLREINRADAGKFDRMNTSAGRLNSTVGLIGATASGAFAGLMAFASADNIIRGLEELTGRFRDLNREVASVAVTAEMRTPEAVASIGSSNEKLALRYGLQQGSVNQARNAYAAVGIDLGSQENILDPTLKAAVSGDTSGETIATAIIAAKQNLGVKDSEVPAALDMMAKGGKLGGFNLGAMAKNFPALGAMMAGTGRQGLAGWGELVALSQVVRTTAGSEDEAANNLRNLLGKLTSQDTVKNFKEKGVDLEQVKKQADATGKPYLTAVMDEIMRLTGGNEFEVNELFGDQQAKLALAPLLNNRKMYDDFLSQIMNNSTGNLDEDYEFLRKTPKEKANRRGAALEATGLKIGEKWDWLTEPFREWFVGTVNPDYRRQEDAVERRQGLLGEDPAAIKAEIAARFKAMADLPRAKGDGPDLLQSQRDNLSLEIKNLEMYLDEVQRAQGGDGGALGKSTGAIPIPKLKSVEQKLGGDLSPAASQAMQSYNEKLGSELDRAVALSAEKAAEMQRLLNFTAQPTIQPNFIPPVGGGAAATTGQQHTSVSPTSNRFNQTIVSPNSMHAARQSRREIQKAQARTLYDTGRRLA